MSTLTVSQNEFQMIRQWLPAVLGETPDRAFIVMECRKQGWGTFQTGQSIHGTPLRLNGQTYTHGLGTHSPSEIVVKSNVPIQRFKAMVGVDDNSLTRTATIKMVFSVECNGKEIFRTQPLAVSDDPVKVDLDLGGVTKFTLKANEVNGTTHLAHADWADAAVVTTDGKTLTLRTSECEGFFPSVPFSFQYNGQPSGALLNTWKKATGSSDRPNGVKEHWTTWTDPKTGLQCRVEVKEFSDFPAVEWVLRFKNTGTADTPILENIQALDLAWSGIKNPTLTYSYGSNLRLDDFLCQQTPIKPGEPIHKNSTGGRSSENILPFFNVSTAKEGFITAIGWSGQWAADFAFDGNIFRTTAGMEKTHLKLHPGEEIRTPSILILYWQGEQSLRGHNLLRRFILTHHTYRPDGKTIPTPITAAHWGGMKTHCHLDRVKAIAEQKLDYDYYWIDAGWYGPADSYSPDEFLGDWWQHVGNWSVNPTAHPNGLKPISDAVHKAGMKFLLWFEPERAIYGTPLTLEHPEWFLGEKKKGSMVLFNLGNPEACKWMTDFISGMIKEHGVDCYRQDFNCSPLPLWQSADTPDRQGITEAKYIEGLYQFWDGLLRQNPGLIIDNCASGGRRIDLELTGRSIPLWRSDIQCWPDFDPTAGQVQTFGLAHWVPCSTTGTQTRPGDTYNFRSAMCTGVQFSMFAYERIPIDAKWPYDWHRKMLADLRRAIPYYLGDYYPLTVCTTSAHEWMAYQMHREDLNEGFVLAFRREKSPFVTADFILQALNEKASYIFEDADTGQKQTLSGETLKTQGLRITMETPRSAKLLFYRKA